MADFQPSGTSITVVAPIKDASLGETGREQQDEKGGGGEGEHADAPRPAHDASNPRGGGADVVHRADVDSLAAHSAMHEAAKETQDPAKLQPSPPQPSSDTATTTAQPQPQHTVVPLKRFTSVNINKRFLEKTSSTSGTSSGGSQLAGHVSGAMGGSGQRRGASPASARSPSTDRPAPSRLVTAKLTAVPQPSTASTSGWLRTNSSTPGTSAAPTPASSSPQPLASGPAVSHTQPVSSTGAQQPKHRFGELPPQNGPTASGTSPFPAQQAGSKPVWGKVPPPPPPPPPSNARGRDTDGQMNDFPTAAEAAHGRKTKALNAQMAAETAAAQTAAQKHAMNETAAAFRGAHLDPKAHHWDEMEDEDSDFLAGVIEFGDGTQYKIEHKIDSPPSQDRSSSLPTVDSAKSQLASHPPVSKEERFGEDFDRSWPRARTSPVQPTLTSSLPPRIVPPQHGGPHHSPTDSPTSSSTHSPYDGTSLTSRVLFNERSNRLEPWSTNKQPRLGPGQAPGPTARRGSREDHPPFGLPRQQALSRDAPPHHSHPPLSNVQLLQKGGADSAWKGGPPRGFNHAPERGRWGAPPPREEDRPWETHRRESMSSSDAAGTSARELSRDRETERSRMDIGTVGQQREQERRNSNAGIPPPALPQPLVQDRSRDTGRQLPPHLSRMPPPPVPPARGPDKTLDAGAPSSRPPAESPSASNRSLLSPASERAPSATGAEEGIDKNALVKDAMQLAIERAKRRKQEGEEEEKRRLEAAERARKKAETLATAQEEKKKAQTLPPAEAENKVLEKSAAQEVSQTHPSKINGIEVAHKSREPVDPGAPKKHQASNLFPKGVFNRPPAPRGINLLPGLPPTLPRRPSNPPTVQLTPASTADSWRSKAAPVPSSPPRPQLSSPPPLPPSRGALPPTTKGHEIDLSLQPDENIEVVDFCDLGKLMGHPSSPGPSSPTLESEPASTRARRPVASDFFDDRPSSSRDGLSPVKSEMPSWRRPTPKPMVESPPQSSGEELGTQTMPIFSTDEPIPVREVVSAAEAKPLSTPSSSPPLNRHSSQSDHASSNYAAQSAHVPPTVMALRSPRTPSHFKEAPMSTLTDTMSRIKGALDGMQSQDPPAAFQLKELKEKDIAEQRLQGLSLPMKAKATETSAALWRGHRDSRSESSSQVTKILSPPISRPSPREVFDVTRPDIPLSPKPVWNVPFVRLPKISHPRDAISRRQLHFWNLPHPGVRWDILSWEPPVEGMNKRELSRDEIFHRKYAIKGGKLRVLLPSKRIVHPLPSDPLREGLKPSFPPVLVTSAGVKIKLPPNTSSSNEKAVIPSRTISLDHSRELNVPSWRKSAMPPTQPKKGRQSPTFMNRSPTGHELITTSRSPPPEPSTPLPQLPPPKNGITASSSPASPHSATVSLPTGLPARSKTLASKRPSGADVAFFRTSRGEPGADNRKPLPRFTVTSELDRPCESTSPATDHMVAENNKVTGSGQSAFNPLRDSPRSMPRAELSLPGLVSGNSESKNDEAAPGNIPVTPPSTHTSSAWGKSPLSFSLKESPARSAPDPEHLKAVWSQPSGRTTTTTSNSLKGIADDLPSIPFTVQDMKSEDGETPPPTAPAPPPSRLSLQEVTRAFQQVPGGPAPATSPSSRPLSYAPTPLLSSGAQQSYRSNQGAAMSLPPQHGVRPTFAPYAQSMVGHSPSPTLMYAPGITSPASHHRMAINGPSPPVAHPVWLPTPPPPSTQAAAFMRAPPPPPAPMMYPSPVLGASPGAPGHIMDRRIVSPPDALPPGPTMYHGHPVDMQGHLHQAHAHAQSPHHSHTHPVAHPVPHMHHIFSPPPHGQAPAVYGMAVGAGRGMVPRPGYEGMQQVPHLPPHNPGYQPVPPTLFSHPFHS